MNKVYYEKRGRRYVPVAEYDSDFLDSFPQGNHLVMCYPGGKSRKFNINPNHAAMIAAGRVACQEITSAIVKASELRPTKTPITERQKKAWEKLAKEFGSDLCTLQGPSIHDCVQAGINAMIKESEELLTNPAVKKAYEQFLLVCELTREHRNEV